MKILRRRRHTDPEPERTSEMVEDSRRRVAETRELIERVTPGIRELEYHKQTNHIYASVLASLRGAGT